MKRYIFIGPLVLLCFWSILTYGNLIKPILLPPPHDVGLSLLDGLFLNKNLLMPLFETFWIWIVSFLSGSFVGIALGIPAGYSDKFYSSFEIIIDFFRSLPSLLIIPIAIIFFGIGNLSAFVVIGWATFFYIFINTVYGVKYGRKNYLSVTRLLNVPKFKTFTKIIFPSALPYIFAGLRLGLSVAIIVTVGIEMILGRGGLGGRVYDAFMIYDITQIYVIILLVGILGYSSNKILIILEHRIIHWKGE